MKTKNQQNFYVSISSGLRTPIEVTVSTSEVNESLLSIGGKKYTSGAIAGDIQSLLQRRVEEISKINIKKDSM